jgi:2',3'-cyclic-nucleotide 2'-phosphodiesterase (5'-nucleotidase family)
MTIVTRGDLISMVPFQNTMATFSVKGSTILSMFKYDVSTQRGAGGHMQISGAK